MKRPLLALLCLWLLQAIPSLAKTPPGTLHIFAPDKAHNKILSFAVHENGESITIEKKSSLSLPFTPATTAVHPGGKLLTITNGGKAPPFAASAKISENGALHLIQSSPLPHPSGYTSVDRSGQFFMTANYREGSVSSYKIDDDGSIGTLVSSIHTPLKEAHCVLTTPGNRFAYIPCVKLNNAIFQYAFDSTSGQLTPLEPFDAKPPAMFGPRHVAYHPTLPIAYFSNEQQIGISVYEIGNDGQLQAKQHATTIARRSPYIKGERGFHASDLVLSPDGRHLFVAVRDFVSDGDSIFTFRIEKDGRLSLTARTPVGDIPWKLALSPEGKYLFVSETTDRRLAIFAIQSGGTLAPATTLDWCEDVRDFAVVRR